MTESGRKVEDYRAARAADEWERPVRRRWPCRFTRARYSYQQFQVLAFLVGKFQKHLLAFGVLKTLSILLEEAVRATFATDANQERLLIVHAARRSIGALGKQSVRGPFEKQKRRSRFELRVALKQFAVSCLELAECSFSSLARSSNTFRPRASRVSRAARL